MNTRSKSSLFLIELIIVILVFSLSAAVCLRMFFQSRLISNESRNISQAALAVQSVADSYKSQGGDYEKTAKLLGGTIQDEKIYFYYSSIWERVEGENGALFIIDVTQSSPQHKESIVTASDLEGSVIFTVRVRGGLNLD